MFNTLPYKRDDLVLLSFISKEKEFILRDKDDNIIPYVIVNCKREINTEIEDLMVLIISTMLEKY